jgi:hypothetical protein
MAGHPNAASVEDLPKSAAALGPASIARRQAQQRRRREAQMASWARALLRGPGGPRAA